MERRRRSDVFVQGDREARNIATTLGRDVRATRRRRHWTQAQLADKVGLEQSRISEIERGLATGTPLIVWVRLGMILGRPLGMAFARDLVPQPSDAGHLDAQEAVLRITARTSRSGRFELATKPADPLRSADLALRDDVSRELDLLEIWNRFDDVGAGARSTDRKVAEAQQLAIAIGNGRPYRVAWCWVLVDNATNRALVARYPAVLRARCPGSSPAWVRALTDGTPAPRRPGLVWIDPKTGRLSAVRLRSADR
jgi:transcriptional regulator with XRE-family HTH domain